MRRIRSKTSVTGCKGIQKQLLDQPPESPVIGLIENPAAVCQDAGTSGRSKESNPEAPKPTPTAASEDTSATAGIGSSEAEGSRNASGRVVPFQSLPQSAQEEMGKELFDDPLLSIDNVKKSQIVCSGASNIPK